MIGDRIPVTVLCAQHIANISEGLRKSLRLPAHCRSVALLSTDCDDATYIALDEATKKANVEVVYARSLYAGATNASTKLAGEVIGILGGENPSEVRSGLQAAAALLQAIGFQAANDEGSVVCLAHCVSRTGSYLSKLAHIPAGQALAYLIAPPVEAIYALDAALKAADVKLQSLFAPPSETNFGGGLLTGTQSACKAACDAFADAVRAVAARPIDTGGRLHGIG